MENLPILQDFVPYRGRCPKRQIEETRSYLRQHQTRTGGKGQYCRLDHFLVWTRTAWPIRVTYRIMCMQRKSEGTLGSSRKNFFNQDATSGSVRNGHNWKKKKKGKKKTRKLELWRLRTLWHVSTWCQKQFLNSSLPSGKLMREKRFRANGSYPHSYNLFL